MKKPCENGPFVMPENLRNGCPKCGTKDGFILQVERVFRTPVQYFPDSGVFILTKSKSEEFSRDGYYRFNCEKCNSWFAFIENIEANQVWSYGA